jgi:tetratricopeptide (TPR) repeat protein
VTSSSPQPAPWLLAGLLTVLVSGVVGLQVLRERMPSLTVGDEELLYVRSPEAMKRMAIGYDALLADAYWIRAVQHFGDIRRATSGPKDYTLLYPLLDLTTSLDPLFDTAYQFGAIFLAEPPPGGPGRPDDAVRLLEKGVAAQPEDWRLVQALGFVHYWWRQDYVTAAQWFEKAAKIPGAPVWVASLAAATMEHGGNRNASRQMWLRIAQDDSNDWFRAEAQRRLRQLDALDQMDALRGLVHRFEAVTGRMPASWQDLVAAALLGGVPVDPLGTAYRLERGAVGLDAGSPLLPLPDPARVR